jgi:hypothetical protein
MIKVDGLWFFELLDDVKAEDHIQVEEFRWGAAVSLRLSKKPPSHLESVCPPPAAAQRTSFSSRWSSWRSSRCG